MGALNRAERPLQGRSVAVYGSGGAPWHHLALAAAYGATVRPLRARDLAAGALDATDVLIVPGGGATAMQGLLAPLGASGSATIRDWVHAGGTWISSCAGSILPLSLDGDAERALPDARHLRMTPARLANPGDATLGGLASPGVGRIRVGLQHDHPYAQGLPDTVELVHYNGPFFAWNADEPVQPFAYPLAAEAAFTAAESFLQGGREVGTTTLERAIADRAATAIETPFGAGRVVQFGSHPEFGLGPLLLGWSDGAQLLVQALAAAPARATAVASQPPALGSPGAAMAVAERTAASLRRAADRLEALAVRDAGGWLEPQRAASFGGRDARTIWRDDLPVAASVARDAAVDLEALAPDLGPTDLPWLDDPAPEPQDFGFEGLLQLAQRIERMTDRAHDACDEPAEEVAHAYDRFDTHPYHQAVASYLSAAGLTAAAATAVSVLWSARGRTPATLAPRLFLGT